MLLYLCGYDSINARGNNAKAYEDLTPEEQAAELQAYIADKERWARLGRTHGNEFVKQMLKHERATLRAIQEDIVDRDAPARRQGMSLVK
jgi:hypothetical protein